MANFPKFLQKADRSRVSLGKIVLPSSTPRESVTLTGNNGYNTIGYSWEGGDNGLRFLSANPSAYRPDLRLLKAAFNGTGWTFTHESRGKSLNYSQFEGYRSLRTEIFELIDGGNSTWRCISGGHVASSIIQPDGVSSISKIKGEDSVTLQSATPHTLFAEFVLPQMPYILAGPANRERYAQAFLYDNGYMPSPATPPSPLPDFSQRRAGIQNTLGYTLQDTGTKTYVDPFSGFANFNRDDYTMTVGQLMQPLVANDLHFMNKLSSSRVLVESLNHFKANGRPLGDTFGMEILTARDPEEDLLHFEASGSLNSIAEEASKHGCWLYWWDSYSTFHFIPDYCTMNIDEIPVAMTFENGPGFLGEIEIIKNTSKARVKRVGVKGQPLLSFGDATSDPATTYFDNMRLGRTYPIDVPNDDRAGAEVLQENYMGKNAQEQARRLWAKSNVRTQFVIRKFPSAGIALGLANRVIAIKTKSSKQNYDFTTGDSTFPYPELTYKTTTVYNPETEEYEPSAGGKLFVVKQVSIDWQDNGYGGGFYDCTLSGEEVIARPG